MSGVCKFKVDGVFGTPENVFIKIPETLDAGIFESLYSGTMSEDDEEFEEKKDDIKSSSGV